MPTPTLPSPFPGDPHLPTVFDFLLQIGLEANWHSGASGFIPGVLVKQGGLLVDPLVARASALLHEAAHLAILPARYRAKMNGNLYDGFQAMMDDLAQLDLDPDCSLYRAAIQASDPEATAWAWAAGLHLGLPPQAIIQDDEYDMTGASIRLGLQVKAYLGINGLMHAGFCVNRADLAKIRGLPVYPALQHWLQPAC